MPRIRSINEEDLNAMVGRLKAADSEAKLLAENLAKRQKETLPDFEKCVCTPRFVVISEFARRNLDHG